MKHAIEAPSPTSRKELDEIVEKVLRRSGVRGKLPTDLDAVAESLHLDILDIDEGETRHFFASLGPGAADLLRSGLNKLRGFADLRSNIIAIPDATNITEERKRFAGAHEIAHQAIPWHKVRQAYLDDGETLAPTIKQEFEREANCAGASLLFQGLQFPKLIGNYRPTIANILTMDYAQSVESCHVDFTLNQYFLRLDRVRRTEPRRSRQGRYCVPVTPDAATPSQD